MNLLSLQINSMVDEIPYITDLQKKFYRVYIKARYDLILKPVFDRATCWNLEEKAEK